MNNIPNIFLIGPMAAGKSTIGKLLANALRREFYDTDREIEMRTGATVAWIYDVEGEQGFQKREEALLQELTALPNVVIATGGGTVLSPVSRSLLASRGYVIYLSVALEHQVARTRRDTQRPLLYKTDARQVLYATNAQCEPLYAELADWSQVTDDRPSHWVVNQILTHLQEQ